VLEVIAAIGSILASAVTIFVVTVKYGELRSDVKWLGQAVGELHKKVHNGISERLAALEATVEAGQ